jgi:RNA polymerase-associated protein CTR9
MYISNVQILLYLARAHFRREAFPACARTLERALHISPDDATVRFSLAIAQQAQARALMLRSDSTSSEIAAAVALLHSAQEVFQFFKTMPPGSSRLDERLPVSELRHSDDLLRQVESRARHVARREAESQRVNEARRAAAEEAAARAAAEEAAAKAAAKEVRGCSCYIASSRPPTPARPPFFYFTLTPSLSGLSRRRKNK